MADPFRKVQVGVPVPRSATAYNAMVDAALAHRRHERDRRSGLLETSRDGDIIRLVNDTGIDLDRNSVVGLGGPIFTPSDSEDAFLREVAFRGVVPTAGHHGKFAVLLEPAKDGRVIRAFVSGVTQVRVNVVDVDHRRADVAAGDTGALVSMGAGTAKILWKEADEAYYGYTTGEQWAIVLLGAPLGGKIALSPVGGIPAMTGLTPGSATCTIYFFDGTTLANDGAMTVFNAQTAAIGGNKTIQVKPVDGHLFADVEDCPP